MHQGQTLKTAPLAYANSISLSYRSCEMLDTFLDNVLGIGEKQWYKACTEFHEGIWEAKTQEARKILLRLIIVHIEQ